LSIGDSFCAYTVAQGKPFLVTNALSHPTLRKITAVRTLDLVAYAGVPIRSAGGQSVGTVCVFDRVPREWDPKAVRCLEDLALLIGSLVDASTRGQDARLAN